MLNHCATSDTQTNDISVQTVLARTPEPLKHSYREVFCVLRDDVLRLGLVEAEPAVLGLEAVLPGREEVEQDVDVAGDFLDLRENCSETKVEHFGLVALM